MDTKRTIIVCIIGNGGRSRWGRAGDKSAEQAASFNEQRDPQAKPAVLQYFGKTAVNNKYHKKSTGLFCLHNCCRWQKMEDVNQVPVLFWQSRQ